MGHIVQMFKKVLLLCAAWLHDTRVCGHTICMFTRWLVGDMPLCCTLNMIKLVMCSVSTNGERAGLANSKLTIDSLLECS